MAYFNYHAKAKKLIRDGKLIAWRIQKNESEETVLVLVFDDVKHPVMKIKQERIPDYLPLLPPI